MTNQKPLPPGLVLRCGCEVSYREGSTPICPTHGPQAVARTVRMPPPRIVGVARGPHVTTQDVDPSSHRFAGSE